ncbi:MAG TPA: alpha/beta hydrolase fold domain-containing protein [Gemmataceae bacterium]|nr:alpha/beta hydrolase fold domain-containing protein [Gemmataceae bacterium]
MARQRGTVGAGVLLGLLVLAVAAKADEAAVVRMVERLGGFVTRDAKRPGKPVVGVNLEFTKVTDTGLKELKELKHLQTLNLDHTEVTDAGLTHLKGLPQLRTLSLENAAITDAGLAHLKGLIDLEVLNLKGTKVTGAGVQDLQNALPRVKIDPPAVKTDPPKPSAQPAVPELMKREVSREGIEYLQKLRKRTPFGSKDFNLDALRAGMGTRREPTIKNVKLIKVKVGQVPCEWVLAPGADPDLRLLYLHGGGFVSGSGGFYLAQAAHISAAAKCAVLLPDYRLAPEHPFPAGLDDCVRAHKWMVANGPAGPGPARATFVAGDSAGGSLTLATLLALRDRRLPLPGGGIALSPTTDLTLASESLKTISDPIISAKTMPVFRDHYLGKKTDPRNPLASPVFGDYRGLPPLLIQAGEHEMLRDDSIRVARKARADGIAVKLEVWPGMFHVFQSHEPLLPEAREAIEHIAEFMRSSLPAKNAQDTPVTVAVSPKAGGHIHPSICRAKDGTLVVVYKGPQVLMRARSTDGGKTWEQPEAIPTTAKRPAVIRETKTFEVYPGTADALPDGRLLVTWNYIADDKAKDGYYERALLYTLSSDQGRTWSEQQLIGPVAGKHLGAVRHQVLPWSDGRWLLPIRGLPPRLFDPRKRGLEVFPLKGPDGKQHAFQQIVRTARGTLLAMGPVFLRSTDQGRTWAAVATLPAVPDGDNAEGRYLTALSDGRVLVTWGVGTANKGLRYNYSADDGQTWNTGHTVTLLPQTNIAARYYSARTIQVDDKHIGTVYLSGPTVYFLKVSVDRLAKVN